MSLSPEALARFRALEVEIRERTCPACRRTLPLDSLHFFRHATNGTGFQSRCKECDGGHFGPTGSYASRRCRECGVPGHSFRDCPRRARRPGLACRQCEGMSWRRPRMVLCACGQRYAAEPAVTLAEILERPRDDRRTI